MLSAAGHPGGDSRWWHPVAALDDLAGPGPWPARLLGQDLVLWRSGVCLGAPTGAPLDLGTTPSGTTPSGTSPSGTTPSGTTFSGGLQAFDDRCPHRGARLSLGRVVGDQLQCAYHGWCFDRQGACRSVPAVPGLVPPAGHAVPVWHVALAHGLVWLARQPLHAAPPACPGLPARRVVCGPYTVATSAPRVVENFLDTSHFAFVHAGGLGDALHPEVPAYTVDSTEDGRPLIPHYRAWQPRASASSHQGAWVDYRYEVLTPYTALLSKQPADGGVADAYTAFACPVDEELTRVWFVQFTSDTTTPDAELLAFQDSIFGQDRPVLESQRPKRLPLSGGELHSAADRLSTAYRRWLQQQGVVFGVV